MKKIILSLSLLGVVACSNRQTPKDVVFDFIDAVLTSDSLRVVKDLDVNAYIQSVMTSMSPADSAKVLAEYPVKTIASLLGDGEVRSRWKRAQIIVNQEFTDDGKAEVEVTFQDKFTGNALLTRMQLQRQLDKTWRVTYFR